MFAISFLEILLDRKNALSLIQASMVHIPYYTSSVHDGNGYDPKSGKFTAPVDGVYSFLWSYCSSKGSTAYLGGFLDGTLTSKIGIRDQANLWQNTSGNLIVKMKKGSQFWIQNFHLTAQLIHEDYTYLSGHILYCC